ncbi:hypothetical protein [Streptomyces sp. NPDC047869]|uniref:hypothetical protein n=1 Tax=Streptomyces sp. NPDC047869 TaxID=3154709 RepID=UPI0034554F26
MQTSRIETPSPDGGTDDAEWDGTGPGRDLSPLVAGAATAVGTVGALLTLTGTDSPLRGPCTLFLLLAAPAAAIGSGLRGLEPFGRAIAALAGAVVLNMLVAQGMLAAHRWSVRGGAVAVMCLSLLVFLSVRAGRTVRPRNRPKSDNTD